MYLADNVDDGLVFRIEEDHIFSSPAAIPGMLLTLPRASSLSIGAEELPILRPYAGGSMQDLEHDLRGFALPTFGEQGVPRRLDVMVVLY